MIQVARKGLVVSVSLALCLAAAACSSSSSSSTSSSSTSSTSSSSAGATPSISIGQLDRTFDAIEGLPRAVVHLYIATSPVWREVVLGRDRSALWATVRAAAGHTVTMTVNGTATAIVPGHTYTGNIELTVS